MLAFIKYAAGTLVLIALALQLIAGGEDERVQQPINLASQISSSVTGWEVVDLPLGETEIAEEAAARQLVLDDFVNRRYIRGSVRVGVYVGYWAEGNMDTRFVASHTPDRCWVQNGWSCTAQEYSIPIQLAGQTTKPSQYREFQIHDEELYVYYWHLVEDGVYDYGERLNTIPDPRRYMRDFFRQLQQGSPEQFFIRIDSTVPFDELLRTPSLNPLWEDLLALGLQARASSDG